MIYDEILNYIPVNEQEEKDKKVMLDFLSRNEDAFLRENKVAHFTASSWIVNKDFSKVLLAYHKIYDSWAWTGGHADGDKNLLHVAIKEACEETGLKSVRPYADGIFSLETIVVEGHEKRGEYVPSHLHMNVTYLLQADENERLTVKEDENSSVGWFSINDTEKVPSEPWMINRIYRKLNKKVMALKNRSGV